MWEAINTVGLIILGLISLYTTRQVHSVHLLVNSRLTQLLELTAKASKAEGAAEEKGSK